MGAAVAVADFDRDGWQDLYVTNSAEGSLNRLYRNKGDGTFADVAAAMGVADVNRAGTGVSMGAVWGDYDNDGFEDLLLYKYGRPELFRNDEGSVVRPRRRARRAAGLGQRQQRHLARLRPRRLARPVHRRLLGRRRRPLEPEDHADHAGELRVREQRRPQVPAPQPRRRHVRGHDRRRSGIRSRRWTLAVAAADLLGTGYPDLFLANDYGVSELYANQGGKRFVDVGRRDRRRPHAEERHERVVRRRVQRRPAVDLQDQHLRAGRARAGQRPLGAEARRGRRRTSRASSSRTWRRAWASTSAAGAGARSSAT